MSVATESDSERKPEQTFDYLGLTIVVTAYLYAARHPGRVTRLSWRILRRRGRAHGGSWPARKARCRSTGT